ncbi:MAG: hypothetical protein WC632_01405 [Candidatus Margulisiibacteriota bacterium]
MIERVLGGLRTATIPKATKPKSLIKVRDGILTPLLGSTQYSDEARTISSELNSRLVKMTAAGPGEMDPEETLNRANQVFQRLLQKGLGPLGDLLTLLGHDCRRLFQTFDAEYQVVTLPDLVFVHLVSAIGQPDAFGFNMGGVPVVADSLLTRARENDKEAQLVIQHERRHFDFRSIHQELMLGEIRLVGELYADYAAYLDVYGLDSFKANTFGQGTGYDNTILRRLLHGCDYTQDFSGPVDASQKAALSVRAATANTLLVKLIAGDPVLCLDYLKTLSSFDQVICMVQQEDAIINIVKYFISFFASSGLSCSPSQISLEKHPQLQAQFTIFAQAFFKECQGT